MKYRLAYLLSHPIQYQAPLLRFLAQQPELELTVFFLSDFSVREFHDPGFGVRLGWDIPLLEGYRHRLLPGWGNHRPVGRLQPFNHGVSRNLAQGFDALWVHGYAHPTNLRAIAAARRHGLKVLMRGDSFLGGIPGGRFKAVLKSFLLTRLFRNVDAFLSIGQLNREYYRAYGAAADRIFPMPHAVDNRFFREHCQAAAENREQLRAGLGLAPGRPVILYAAKFQPRKRPLDLWQAYRRLSPDGKTAPLPYLLFVGDGELRSLVEDRVRETGWDSVRFLGFRNQMELPGLYDLCDVFVLPSEFEPWGLAVNEVMNAARPVIVSDAVGCGPDLVTPGETGRVYPLGDTDALAAHLRELTEHPDVARRMGEAALRRVSQYNFEADWRGLRAALAFVLGRGA